MFFNNISDIAQFDVYVCRFRSTDLYFLHVHLFKQQYLVNFIEKYILQDHATHISSIYCSIHVGCLWLDFVSCMPIMWHFFVASHFVVKRNTMDSSLQYWHAVFQSWPLGGKPAHWSCLSKGQAKLPIAVAGPSQHRLQYSQQM